MPKMSLAGAPLLLLTSICFSAAPATQPALQRMTWQVDGVTREALVYLPPKTDTPSPIVFAFHGHGGNSRNAARKFSLHTLWPDAICVYPKGLLTKTIMDPNGRLPGWQKAVGDQSDRDVHFFDAMLKTLQADHHADPAKVFVTGHSNGAFFTYALLCARPDAIAAIAPIAGLSSEKDLSSAKPKPIFHIAGQKDPLVRYDQQLLTIERDLKLNHCDPTAGKPAGPLCTEYQTPDNPPVLTLIHPGGHEIPQAVPERIANFFKQQIKR